MRILRWFICTALVAAGACGSPTRGPGGLTDASNTSDQHDAPPNTGDTSRVYAHSGTTLYRIDTHTFAPQMIGDMTGLAGQSLTDLAVDKDDHMVGITLDKLYGIDSTTGTVTLIKDLSQSASGFTSLSYVPTDLNDSASPDILVSANDQGDAYQIDPTTGNATKIGSYGTVAQGKVISSGDLIGIRGLGIYATVNVGTSTTDYLAKIDPVTWKATPLGTGTGYSNIFGLGYWAGTFYGFIDAGAGAGKMITIDQNTGAGTLIKSGSERWYGAGVTTNAPILQ
ncbi:MAG: hypothetical protein ABJE66_07380 [Deltaproteobacteria bacterium]